MTPPGETVSVKWKDGSHEGPALERTVYGDNLEGKRESELVVGCGYGEEPVSLLYSDVQYRVIGQDSRCSR